MLPWTGIDDDALLKCTAGHRRCESQEEFELKQLIMLAFLLSWCVHFVLEHTETRSSFILPLDFAMLSLTCIIQLRGQQLYHCYIWYQGTGTTFKCVFNIKDSAFIFYEDTEKFARDRRCNPLVPSTSSSPASCLSLRKVFYLGSHSPS